MKQEIDYLRKKITTPLLSKAGKAITIPNLRKTKKPSLKKSSSPQVVTMEQIHQELKKIEAEKYKTGKIPDFPSLSSCFKSVSRSSNASPINHSPAPGSYYPKYEFFDTKVKGNIRYKSNKKIELKKFKRLQTSEHNTKKTKKELETSKSEQYFEIQSKYFHMKSLGLDDRIKRNLNMLYKKINPSNLY